MSKTIALLAIVLLGLASLAAAGDWSNKSEEEKKEMKKKFEEKLNKTIDACYKESGYKSRCEAYTPIIEIWTKSHSFNDQPHKFWCLSACIMQQKNMMTADGTMNFEKAPESCRDGVKECDAKYTGNDKCERVQHFMENGCFETCKGQYNMPIDNPPEEKSN